MNDDYGIHVVFAAGGLIGAVANVLHGEWTVAAFASLMSLLGWTGVWMTFKGRRPRAGPRRRGRRVAKGEGWEE